MIYTLTHRAQDWLKSQPNSTATIEQLIELAEGDSWLSLRIAKALDLDHPDRAKLKRGAPERVTDDELQALISQGLTTDEIAKSVGMGLDYVRRRITKLINSINEES